jgi:lysozyme
VGYGHRLQKGEHFSSNMPEWQADSLLRADLMAQFDRFKCYGKDALLLSLLAYNVGAGRILGYGKQPKSQLLRKIEAGDRNFYQEYISFCRYKGKVLSGLIKRRQVCSGYNEELISNTFAKNNNANLGLWVNRSNFVASYDSYAPI